MRQDDNHQIEQVGAELRRMMSWISAPQRPAGKVSIANGNRSKAKPAAKARRVAAKTGRASASKKPAKRGAVAKRRS